ncbi:MAG TPA: peptidylprolyl isomerase [Kofleriaceae bacterium]|nr:peptidylprolyl isomerase [Kofleriaceae bacterium]
MAIRRSVQIVRRATAVATACQVALVVWACGGKPSEPAKPTAPDDRALRVRIAHAEARRAAGLDELLELAKHGTTPERVLALRGLGRVGGPRALDALIGALRDPDPEILGAAGSAIGVLASLDESDAGTPALTRALVDALPRAKDHAPAIIEAIGRAGDVTAQRMLAMCVEAGTVNLKAEACAIALGRYGRRKLAFEPDARSALGNAIESSDARVRYAAVWALSREHKPTASAADEAIVARLAKRLADEQPETRAQAAAALAKRPGMIAARGELAAALRDRDWRVAVEAVRALTGEHADPQSHDAVATALGLRFAQLEAGDATEAHVVAEALRALASKTARPSVLRAIEELVPRIAAAKRLPPLTRGWIACLAQAAIARGAKPPDYAKVETCGGGELPDHLRLPLLGDLVTANTGTLAQRRGAVKLLLAHADARVRVAGLAALPALWKAGDDGDRRAALATVIAALGSTDPVVAGNAVDAATAVYEAGDKNDRWDRAALDAAVVGRARIEKEAELGAALLELIGKREIASGAPACRAALGGAPVLARAAATCLSALGEPATAAIGAAEPPALDVASVIGRRLLWHLQTTRGEILIVLRPDVAPWAVAAIVALTRKGLYDNLEFHRVVPDFVVQGGDPTQSGWGGPGFTLPAEPSAGAGYVTGGVGMADAGRDSAGSQWFVMHARAPHLDGRYTWVGSVEAGQPAADALVIGDRVIRATIEEVRE